MLFAAGGILKSCLPGRFANFSSAGTAREIGNQADPPHLAIRPGAKTETDHGLAARQAHGEAGAAPLVQVENKLPPPVFVGEAAGHLARPAVGQGLAVRATQIPAPGRVQGAISSQSTTCPASRTG